MSITRIESMKRTSRSFRAMLEGLTLIRLSGTSEQKLHLLSRVAMRATNNTGGKKRRDSSSSPRENQIHAYRQGTDMGQSGGGGGGGKINRRDTIQNSKPSRPITACCTNNLLPSFIDLLSTYKSFKKYILCGGISHQGSFKFNVPTSSL